MSRRLSLGGRVGAFVLPPLLIVALAAAWLGDYTGDPWLGVSGSLLLGVPLLVLALRRALAPSLSLLRSLTGVVQSVRDGDFSVSFARPRERELAELVDAHNALGDVLREERQHLGQRELLLDTVVQNTPVAMVLTEARRRIVYANLAARRLFDGGRRLEGQDFDALLAQTPTALREAAADPQDRLCTLELEGQEETFHVSQRGFRLNGQLHRMHLFRRLTQELARQEVRTWKKVIRVISHELNNSLGPISSLAHTGAELLKRGDHQRLSQVFAAIDERSRHLDFFIQGYARFAKLPAPRLQAIAWPAFLEGVRAQLAFTLVDAPEAEARCDPAQLEQVLINLIKNAAEAGSAAEAIELSVRRAPGGWRLELRDRGSGMSEAVLSQALLPFYSTKRSGTGLGLALAREILEAHGGSISLANRDGGGLCVTLFLPN